MQDILQTIINENLTEGLVVKNYKELCALLKQKPVETGGNAKKAQIKEFERYFNYKKVGHKFIIKEIYDKPLPKVDGRTKGNNSIYIKYIETILLRYLSKQKHFTCTLKKTEIWLLLGMVNEKYSRISEKELEKIDSQMTSYEINNFYQRCNQKLSSILTSALKSLSRRCLISYSEQLMIVDINFKSSIATDEEIRLIDAIKRNILVEMGFEDIVQVFCKFKNEEFYKKVNAKLLELYQWRYTFKQYKIIYTHENIVEAMTQQEIELEKISLNQEIINVVDTQAKNNVKKQECKFQEELEKEGLIGLEDTFGIEPKDFGIFSYPEFYIEIQKRLSKELLQLQIDNNNVNLQFEDILSKEENELFAC